MQTEMRQYALSLLRRGIISCPVLPGMKYIDFAAMGCPPDNRINEEKQLRKLSHTSTAVFLSARGVGEKEVAEWFDAAGHRSNIGIVSGYENLVILDFDDDGSFRYFERQNTILVNSTPVEKTPNGYHVYVRSRKEVFCTILYIRGSKGGHISGIGGFATCAPSQLAEGPAYCWLPGRSILEIEPQTVEDLGDIGIFSHRLGVLARVMRR